MSAFLGPIHTWLFNKIRFQDHFCESLIQYAVNKRWNNDIRTSSEYQMLESGDLEHIVDQSNIHGWLQDRVSLVEHKLAFVMTELTRDHMERLFEIYARITEIGKEHAFNKGITVKEAFQQLDSILLNGMPCDRVNEVISEEENRIVWRQTQNIHAQYWDEVGGDSTLYDEVRNHLILGLLDQTGIHYHVNDNIYELRKGN